jgi:hypothetical protein
MTFRRQFGLGMLLAAVLLAAAYIGLVAIELSESPEQARQGLLGIAVGTFAFLGLFSFGLSLMRGYARLVFVQNGELPSSLFERLDWPLWHWWFHIDPTGKDRDA